jgi:type II secretory pathway component PulJ
MRRRLRHQDGITVVDVVVATALVAVVSAVFLPIMATSTRSVHPMQMKSQSIDSLRNALAAIGREMRSAACVTEPAANAGAGNRLRFTTDANNSVYEVTYSVEDGRLLRQVTGESTVTLLDTGLGNGSDAFTHIATPRRTVKVLFHFQHDPDEPVLELSTVMAGRNAWHAC